MKHSTFFAIIQLVGSCASPVFAQEIDINAELHKNWGQNSDAKFTIKWKQAITITGYVDEAAFKEMSAYAELRRAAEIESRKQDGTAIITAELKRPKEQQYSNLYTISIDGSKWKIIKKGYLYIPSQSNEPISHDYSVLYNGDKVIEYVNPGLKESAFGSLNNMTTNVFFDTDVGRIIYCQLLGAQHPLLRRFITDNLEVSNIPDISGRKAVRAVAKISSDKTTSEYTFLAEHGFAIIAAKKYSDKGIITQFEAEYDRNRIKPLFPKRWVIRNFQNDKLISVKKCELSASMVILQVVLTQIMYFLLGQKS